MRSIVLALVTALLAGSAGSPAAAATGDQVDERFAAGTEVIDLRGTRDNVAGVAVRPDGRILVGGTADRVGVSGRDPAFVQLLADGSLDGEFGGSRGRRFLDLGSAASLADFTLTGDGKVVGVAATSSGVHYVFRLNADGSFDTTTDGDPASSFGKGGVVELDEDGTDEIWTEVAVQDDGGVIVAGGIEVDGQMNTAVTRLTADGKQDAAFGPDGTTLVKVGAGFNVATDLTLLGGGDRIGLSTYAQTTAGQLRVGVVQLLRGGDADPAFSGDGKVVTGFGSTGIRGNAVTYQPNGRIVVAGQTEVQAPRDLVLLRYTPSGALDTNFSSDGVATFSLPQYGTTRSVFPSGSGTITALGAGTDGIAGVRVTSAGALDQSFAAKGRMLISGPPLNDMRAATRAADGEIVTVGITLPFVRQDVIVNRFTSAGAPDETFRPAGTAIYPDGATDPTEDAADGVAVDAAGRIVLAGVADIFGEPRMRLIRLFPNGFRDPTYGSGGRADATFVDAQATDVATDGNRAVLVGCRNCNGPAPDFAVARFTARGLPDTSFSGDGHVAATFGAGVAEVATAVDVQDDRRIVVAGTAGDDVALVRYNVNGTRDTSFSGDGRVRISISDGSVDTVTDLVVQPNGRIVVVGGETVSGVTRFAVLRFRSNGTLDPTFGGDGKVLTDDPFDGERAEATAVALRPDGRILVAGTASTGTRNVVAVLRYLSNGTPDSSYGGGDGIEAHALSPAGDNLAAGVAPGPSDSILVGGWYDSGVFFAARFLASANLDPTFGEGGRDIATFDGVADARAMAVHPANGGMIVVGEAVGEGGFYDFAVARFEP